MTPNEARQCQDETSEDFGAVAVRRELDDGEIMWMIAHPITGGRWATWLDIENIATWPRAASWETVPVPATTPEETP